MNYGMYTFEIDCPDCGGSADVEISWEQDFQAGIIGSWVCSDVKRPCKCDENDPFWTHSCELGDEYASEYEHA